MVTISTGETIVEGTKFSNQAKSHCPLGNKQSARSTVLARPSLVGKRRLLMVWSLQEKRSLSQGEITLPFGKQTVCEE
jgi:hypothetical protein